MADFSRHDRSAPDADDARSKAAAFVARTHPLLIDGSRRPATDGARFSVIDPATGENIATCASGTSTDVDLAVAAARRAFADPTWRAMLPEVRAGLLMAIADTLEAHAEELAAIQSSDLGTTPALSRALVAGGIVGYIAKGRTEGARLVAGGEVRERPGYFVEPTVFADVTVDMTIAREGIFGPVVAIMRFSDEAEAIRIANDVDYGLSASVWTQNVSRMHRTISALEAGTVWGNTLFEIDTKAPFGGYKQSGSGRELGADSIESFTQVKTAMIRFG